MGSGPTVCPGRGVDGSPVDDGGRPGRCCRRSRLPPGRSGVQGHLRRPAVGGPPRSGPAPGPGPVPVPSGPGVHCPSDPVVRPPLPHLDRCRCDANRRTTTDPTQPSTPPLPTARRSHSGALGHPRLALDHLTTRPRRRPTPPCPPHTDTLCPPHTDTLCPPHTDTPWVHAVSRTGPDPLEPVIWTTSSWREARDCGGAGCSTSRFPVVPWKTRSRTAATRDIQPSSPAAGS